MVLLLTAANFVCKWGYIFPISIFYMNIIQNGKQNQIKNTKNRKGIVKPWIN